MILPVRPRQTLSMLTRDRIRLDADVYYPEGKGEFPVLLMRQPYGREIASTVVYAHPTWYAAHGYIVVIQDVRGRGTSEGDFRLFESEVEDGYDSVVWAASLPQSTGKVGMYGFSYQGMTQLYAAQSQPPGLCAIAPAMVGYRPYQDWAYENGALLLQAGLGWALQLATETARLKHNTEAYHSLLAAARSLPLTDPMPAKPTVLETHAPDSFFHDWLAHPTLDDYWERLTPCLTEVDLPMLHVGGWFDPYLRGDIHRFQSMAAQSQQPQQLWIGPWGHLPWGRIAGTRDFSSTANSPIDALQIRWFDCFLKGQETGLGTAAPIHLFEMGANQWRTYTNWPQGQPLIYHLSSGGLAGMRDDDGQLQAAGIPPNSDLTSPFESPEPPDVIVHDPWRPVPSLGGHAGIPSGCFNRASLDSRSDVLTYTTAPLEEAVAIAGTGQVTLMCSTAAPSFDLCVVVSEVYPDGQVYNLTQGYRRVDRVAGFVPEKPIPVTISLHPTCFRVASGHALRLSVSAACFPAYALNSGTGQSAEESGWMTAQTITLALHTSAVAPSVLQLPLAEPT